MTFVIAQSRDTYALPWGVTSEFQVPGVISR